MAGLVSPFDQRQCERESDKRSTSSRALFLRLRSAARRSLPGHAPDFPIRQENGEEVIHFGTDLPLDRYATGILYPGNVISDQQNHDVSEYSDEDYIPSSEMNECQP